MEVEKTTKYWSSIEKWCVGLWCYRGENKQSILCNGWHKKRDKAEKIAMKNFNQHLAFHQEFEESAEKQIIQI